MSHNGDQARTGAERGRTERLDEVGDDVVRDEVLLLVLVLLPLTLALLDARALLLLQAQPPAHVSREAQRLR